MNHPPAWMQPAGANDARPARPVFYQTITSAEAAAHRAARHQSPTNRAGGVEFVPGVLRAVEGGKGYEVQLANIDFVVIEVSEEELDRRVQSGIRRRVAELQAHAAIEDQAALAAKSACFVKMHSKWAAEARNEARELERRLTVSMVRPGGALVDDSEPRLSADRDAREARSL